jgi:hypothetical protein
MGGTDVGWLDSLGNSYSADLDPISLTVSQPTPVKTPPDTTEVTETPSPTVESPKPTTPPKGRLIPQEIIEDRVAFEFTSREGIGVVALTLIVMLIVLRLITLKMPVKEEE